jgi:hypothetical protein
MSVLTAKEVDALAVLLEQETHAVASPTVDGRIYLFLRVDDYKASVVAADIRDCRLLPDGWEAVPRDRTVVEVRPVVGQIKAGELR